MSKSIEGEEYLAVKKAAQLPRRVVPDTTNSTLVTVRQLAQDWQVSLDWIYDRLKPNPPAYLTHVRVGRKILFDRDDLQAYLQLHRRSGTVPVSQVPTREVSMNRVRDQRGTMETAGRKTLCYSLRYRDEQGKSYRHKLGNVNEITRAEAEKLRRKKRIRGVAPQLESSERMFEVADRDLFQRLFNLEDNFVERKSPSDKRDWLPIAVALSETELYFRGDGVN